MHVIGRLLVAVALIVASVTATAGDVAAHERRAVGPYQLVVGWLEEPSYAGRPNAVSLIVTDTRSTPAKAVEGLERTVSVEVYQGGLTTPFAAAFRARPGAPGAYAADLIPTREGGYRFVITGKVESLEVHEVFESGPGRFDEVRSPTALQYPDAVPAGAALARALEEQRSTAERAQLVALAALALAAVALALRFIRPRP